MSERVATERILLTILLLLATSGSQAGDNRWTSTGPYGGSVSQFAFTPLNKDLLFVSGKSAYRSTNSGAQWKRMEIGDFGPIVRIHPANPSTVIAAGYFVFASTDQGNIWRQISGSAFQGSLLNDLEFHPVNPLTLVGVSDKGVFKSTDGGRTWSARNTGMSPAGAAQVEFEPANGSIVYVLQQGGRFWKSTNGGDSWKLFSAGLATSIGRGLAADPNSPGTLYASGVDQVFKTTNGGGQWIRTGCECHVRRLVVDPNDSRIVYGVGDDAVRSADGGATWKRMNIPRLSDTLLLGVGADPYVRNFVLVGSQREGVFRSLNSGISWARANNGLDALGIEQLSISEKRPDRIFTVGQRQLFRSGNSGTQWSLAYKGTSPLDFTTAVQAHPLNGNLVAAAGCCTVAVSVNGGARFRPTRLTSSGIPLAAGFLALDPQSQNRMWITSLLMPDFRPLGILRSNDQGRTFQPASNGIDASQKIRIIVPDPRNGSTLLAGTKAGRIYRSTNGGNSWANSSSGLRTGDVGSIAIDPDHTNNVYAVSGKFLYKSTNGGKAWSLRNLRLSAIPTFVAVDIFDPRRIFAGTFGGLLISKDSGQTWSAFNCNGLGPFQVTGMVNDPVRPNSFYIGTERGVYQFRIVTETSGSNVPLIDQVSPAAGPTGSTITINGLNFGASQGNSRVSFAGTDAGASLSWSESRIQVRVPSGSRTGALTVEAPGGRSNGYQFVVLAPSTGAVQPSSGPSAGGTLVSLRVESRFTGSSFFVKFGDALASDVQFTPPNVVTCRTPPGSGTVSVSIVSVNPPIQNIGTFTYQ